MCDDLLYTSVCSAATLQSNKQGFFQDFADGVIEKAGSEWLNVFEKLPNNREKILKCYADSDVNDVIQETLQNVQILYRTKSPRLAYLRRSEAERCLKSNNYEKALGLLNQSVIRSPSAGVDMNVDDGKTLPLALWERANVLFAMSEFSLCLNDIQLCLKEKLPDPLRVQAYYCMAECYEKLKQIKRARISLQVASKLLSKEDSEWSSKINLKMCNLTDLNDEAFTQDSNCEDLKLTLGENPALPNASYLLSVANSATAGRFVVAQYPVKTGDTLVIEAPYAACLLPEKFGSHCHHCFKRLRIAVSCPECSGVAFCSIDCRDSAIKTYHKYECKYMDIMIGSGMSILCHIALRIITQQNPAYWFNINTNKDDDFNRLQKLVTHSDKRPPKDYFHRTLMALFLLRILQCSGYIASSDIGTMSDHELQIATIILHNLQCLQFNAHEIYETVMKRDKDFKSAHMNYVAVGIYLTVSLFNHDCYPAVTRYFNGKNIVIKAVRPLSPGDVVGENYGPIFTKRTLSERTKGLTSRYWFRCSCKACQEDWPTFDTVDENIVKIRCMQKDCKGVTVTRLDTVKQKNPKCSSCKKTINSGETVVLIKSYIDDFDKGINLMDAGNAEEAINVMCAFSDLMHFICAPPIKKVSLSHEALRTCWANTGNTYVVKGS